MKLSAEQIDQLFAFTKKKHVHHYDVQVEIVDHLASSIEEEMESDSKLTFDAALQLVYKRFGLFGFTHVVQEKQKAVERVNRNIWRSELKSFFTIPKFFFTACVFAGVYAIGGYIAPEWRYTTAVVLFSSLYIYEIVSRLNLRTKKERPLMLTQATSQFSLSFLFIWFLISSEKAVNSNLIFALFATLITITELALIHLTKRIHHQAKERYPEAFA